jgi:hypothetical protein
VGEAVYALEQYPYDGAEIEVCHLSQQYVEAFFRPLFRWLIALLKQPAGGFTLDLDSTIFAREGSQEGAAKGYNPRRPGRKSHHPLLAVLAEAPFVLHAWLRSGNTASGRGVCAFLKEAFAQLPTGWRLRCLRADSGFFDQAMLAMLEEHAVPYIIVARMTTALKARLHSSALVWRDLGKGYAVSSFTLKLHGWSDTRRFVVVRELEREDKSAVGRRLIDVPGYTFRVWVTNRTEDAAMLWRDYNGRATIEQRIEELKNDMHADGFCTRKFFATEAAMLSTIFAYNLLAQALDAACGGIHLRSSSGAHRTQDRAQSVAKRGRSREAQGLDRQCLRGQRANRAAFGPRPSAIPRLGHRGTRRMRDLNPLKRLQSNGKRGVRVEKDVEQDQSAATQR